MPYRPRKMTDTQMLAWLETQYDLNENGCWVWRGHTNTGYGRVGWKNKTRYVHQLYWLLSGRDIPDGLELCHAPGICHNPACYNPNHLRADTKSANSIDCYADGTMSCKLTVDQVRAIRADTRLQKEIATEYGVHQVTICEIKTGKKWSWVV